MKKTLRLYVGGLAIGLTAMASVLPADAAQNGRTGLFNWGRNTEQASQQVRYSGAMDPRYARQTVRVKTPHEAGTVIIDTQNKFLYYVLGDGRAIRYGVGVGRAGFEWTGTERISRKAEWPDWRPPAEMRQRQPYLPTFMPGGENNPLGARALYLGNTLYRIHGTNDPSTIGKNISSGCIRLRNEDVVDLYERTRVGATVIVF